MSQEPSLEVKPTPKKKKIVTPTEQPKTDKDAEEILKTVNTLVQQSVSLSLEALTTTCTCATCRLARDIAPEVKHLLRMGKVRKITEIKTQVD